MHAKTAVTWLTLQRLRFLPTVYVPVYWLTHPRFQYKIILNAEDIILNIIPKIILSVQSRGRPIITLNTYPNYQRLIVETLQMRRVIEQEILSNLSTFHGLCLLQC